MAGNYPDAPSWRMAYDRDGTQVIYVSSAKTLSQYDTATLMQLNNEADDGPGFPEGCQIAFIFPELRDLDAYNFMLDFDEGPYNGPKLSDVQVSTDTTNGMDGTWTSIGGGSQTNYDRVKPDYRTRIVSTTALSIRGVRFHAGGSSRANTIRGVHLYGEPAPNQNQNRLEMWHPTMDEKLPPAYLDWGDVQRSSSQDRQFRVKNLSGVQTAGNIRCAMEALTDTTPSVPAQHTLSYGGGSFLPQVNIGSLGPGAVSGPVTLRRITPSDATLSLWSFRVFAESTEWA